MLDEEAYEERAAILEYEAGWPRRWAEYFARQIVRGPPGDFSPVRWQQALDGALAFADEWVHKAIAAGWEPEDVFGLHPVAPAARYDCRGLAWLLGDGSRVVWLDEQRAATASAQPATTNEKARCMAIPPMVSVKTGVPYAGVCAFEVQSNNRKFGYGYKYSQTLS